jgi:hypothetical protein
MNLVFMTVKYSDDVFMIFMYWKIMSNFWCLVSQHLQYLGYIA